MTLQGYSASDTLTDDAGRAQKGKTLTVTGPGSYVGTVLSDTETGIFRLGPLPIGVYTVSYGDRSAQVPVYPTPEDMQAAYDAAASAATLAHVDAADAALAAADAAEASARAAAVTAAEAAATAATAAEAAARAAADSADATDDAAEVSARQVADAAEASARVAADSAESAARAALDAREAANNAAQASAITDEATARAAAVTAEASARIAADNALQASVAANTSAIALKLSTSVAAGTYAPLDARDTSITSFAVGQLVASGTTLYKVTTAHAAPFDPAKAVSVGGGGGGGGVTSFQTRTGAVTLSKADVTGTGLAKADVGLGNVDNTADTAKPVSTAQQTALDAKAPVLSPTAVKTTAYTAAVGDLAMMNVAGGGTALTLPTAPADRAQVGYRAIGATTAVPLVVTAGGTDTIGTTGATSASIALADEVVVLQYQASASRWLAVSNVKTQASLDTRYLAPLTITTQTASYTAVLADADTLVRMDTTGASTFTVPPNSSVAFAVGRTLTVSQKGAGQVTLTPGAGVTLNSRSGALKTAGQYAQVSLTKTATDEWLVAGDVTT